MIDQKWSVDNNNKFDSIGIIDDMTGECIAAVFNVNDTPDAEEHEAEAMQAKAVANARMMAAAPCMYELLQEAVDAVIDDEWLRSARAAIVKAKVDTK